MRIIRDTTDFRTDRPTAVCIGKFDGVHAGHKALIEKVVAQKAKGLIPTVFTFDPSPDELFSGVHNDELCDREKKIELLEDLGVELLVEYPLTLKSASIEPAVFIAHILVERLKMRYIAAGPDLSYGQGGRGDCELMRKLSGSFGYDVEIIEKIKSDGEDISSSRIRKAIKDGNMAAARRMLGRV